MSENNIQDPQKLTKKYKLDENLNKLSYVRYQQAVRELPGLLGKCKNTVNNYRNLTLGNKTSMPYEVGIRIEKYLGIEPGSLSNEIGNN